MTRPLSYTASDNHWPMSCAIWQTGRRNSHSILLQSMRMSIKFTSSAISGASGNEAANSCSKNRIRLQHELRNIEFCKLCVFRRRIIVVSLLHLQPMQLFIIALFANDVTRFNFVGCSKQRLLHVQSTPLNTLSAKDGDLRLSASNACLPKTEISVFVTECVFFTSTFYKLHMFTLHDVLYS